MRRFGSCGSLAPILYDSKGIGPYTLVGYTLVHTTYFIAHLFLGCSEVVPAPLPASAPLAPCSRAGPVVVHLAALADQVRWPMALVLPLGQGRRRRRVCKRLGQEVGIYKNFVTVIPARIFCQCADSTCAKLTMKGYLWQLSLNRQYNLFKFRIHLAMLRRGPRRN